MALLNVRSLSNKTFIINDLISDNKIDCMFLTETWLSADGPATLLEASPTNYNFSFSARSGKRGGGTATILSAALSFKNITFEEYASFEYHCLVFNSPPVLCVTVYRPPKRCSTFISDFSELLSIIHNNFNRAIILGDFNLHIDNQSDSLASEFLNMLNCMNFNQHVTQPTHNRGHTLDLVITHGLSAKISSVVDIGISDHYCVFFNVSGFNQEIVSERTVRKRYLTPEVTANFTNILHDTPPHFLPSSCDSIVDCFNSKLESTLEKVAPLKLKKIKSKPNPPWKDETIKHLKRKCRVAERKWRKSKLTIHFQIFHEQLTNYNKAIKHARQSYFSNLINDNRNNPKILFSTIDRLINPVSDNIHILSSSERCEEFAVHFRDKIDNIRLALVQQRSANATQNMDLEPISACGVTLDSFVLVNAEILDKVVSQLKSSTCILDPIPTSFFKTVYSFLDEDLLTVVNYSLQMGVFPTAFKTALVKPLLKRNGLDPLDPNSYRPVSNLPFLSKILEKLVFNQLNDFIMSKGIHEKFQSGFRATHSTETALVKVVNDLRCNLDMRKLSVLVLLDLSAAFDTVDHGILLNRLYSTIGISGTVFNWFKSYLSDRKFFVNYSECSSRSYKLNCGVPQGSILGPLLFNLYMLPLGNVIRRHGINFHSYADDTQLYIAVSPEDTGPIDSLFNCILDIKSWMAENFMQLNQDKTEVLVIGPEAMREKLNFKLETLALKPSDKVKNLGVVFDSNLTFEHHIKHITKNGFYHLKNIAKVRPFLSRANTETLIHAFITCRIDYCNALLSGLPQKNIAPLQILQNSAARVLTKTRKRAHITPILKSLHWLPVCFRIDFKILLLVFKALIGLSPSYLSDLLLSYEPTRTLRSSGRGLLLIPKVRTKTHGEAAFCCYGPHLWNSLPEDLRTAESVDIFKNKLKTHLFSLAFD